MFSGAAKRKKKKNEEEQKKRQRGGFQKFLSGSCPTAVNLLVSAEPEAEPGPQPGPEPDPEPGPETRPEDTAENAVAPSTSAPSQNDKMMEEQQPARKSLESLDPERVLTSYPSDPAKWDQIDDRMREYFARNHPCQNIGDFSASKRKNGDINRSLTKEHFFRKKVNGETLSRKWLVYSPSTGTVICYCCKLFSIRDNQFVTGFNDWKNCANRLHEHVNCMDHRTAVLSLSSLGNKNARIDSNIVQQQESEREYWLNILKRSGNYSVSFFARTALPWGR